MKRAVEVVSHERYKSNYLKIFFCSTTAKVLYLQLLFINVAASAVERKLPLENYNRYFDALN